MRKKIRRSARKWRAAMLALLVLASTACAPAGATYLRGDSEAIPLKDGEAFRIPAGWSGAWALSDEALADLLECCEAKGP